MKSTIFFDLFDSEDFNYFIKSVVKLFRLSPEYNMWLNQCNRSTCAATGVNKYESNVDIEVHHYDKTLWGWVEVIVDKFVESSIPFNTFFVLMVLAEIHLQNCVPYVPLMHCIHKMIHNDYENTLKLYPDIERNIFEGNLQKAYDIIDRYVEFYKNNYDSVEEDLKYVSEK